MFESSVNSEGIETNKHGAEYGRLFESSVNSEGIETNILTTLQHFCLRAV